jgi:hypothetical protein
MKATGEDFIKEKKAAVAAADRRHPSTWKRTAWSLPLNYLFNKNSFKNKCANHCSHCTKRSAIIGLDSVNFFLSLTNFVENNINIYASKYVYYENIFDN